MAMGKSSCKEGIRELIDAVFVDAATPEDKEILLFSNDATISAGTVNADLTEITTNGGGKQTLTKANWDAASDADPSVTTYNSGTGVVFSFTGGLTVYGYAVRGVTSGKIYLAENFGVQTYSDGQSLTLNPLSFSLDMIQE